MLINIVNVYNRWQCTICTNYKFENHFVKFLQFVKVMWGLQIEKQCSLNVYKLPRYMVTVQCTIMYSRRCTIMTIGTTLWLLQYVYNVIQLLFDDLIQWYNVLWISKFKWYKVVELPDWVHDIVQCHWFNKFVQNFNYCTIWHRADNVLKTTWRKLNDIAHSVCNCNMAICQLNFVQICTN